MSRKCGLVALLGAPNAGKSTLLNRMAGTKLSIVTPKAQTTRARLLAIVQRGETQIVLVDTPGIFAPRRRLDEAMVEAAWSGVADADLALLLVDAAGGMRAQLGVILDGLAARRVPAWLVINKIDLVAPHELLGLVAGLNARQNFAESFLVSAANGDGVADLLDGLAARLPEGPFLYPEEELTDQSERALAAELVREQIFLQTHQEVPYGALVETERFVTRADGSVRIDAVITVAREGHKAIVIGAGGARLRQIGSSARAELGRLLERKVHLFLTVRVRPGWDDDAAQIRRMGLGQAGPG